MEKKTIKEAVSARLKKLEKLGERISKDFADEDIHKFRIEVKKLRALLRLIALELRDPGEMKLPKKLKKIYAAAGVIRDVHLHVERMEEAIPKGAEKPESYYQQLNEKVDKSKKQLSELLSGHPFRSIKKKIMEQLPQGLRATTIEAFVHQKIAMITTAIKDESKEKEDEDIHTIRKHLKDLMYNVKGLQDGVPANLPAQLITDRQFNAIEALARKLGEYNDVCFATSFLGTAVADKLKKHDKKQLLSINDKWLQDKEKMRQAAMESLTAFQSDVVADGSGTADTR